MTEKEIITKSIIRNDNNIIVSTGYAHEIKTSSGVNSDSFVENAETSSVGRALAFLRLSIEGGIASADEMRKVKFENKPNSTQLNNELKERMQTIFNLSSQKSEALTDDQKNYISEIMAGKVIMTEQI